MDKNNENNKIWDIVDRLKKQSSQKIEEKEAKKHEQYNLLLDDETPETTVKRSRNTKPRGQKPASQNLNNQKQQTLRDNSESVAEGIAKMRVQLAESREEQAKREKLEKDNKKKKENDQRIKKMRNRLRK